MYLNSIPLEIFLYTHFWFYTCKVILDFESRMDHVSYRYWFGYGISEHTNWSTSAEFLIVKSFCSHNNIWACEYPLYWNSITYVYAITLPNILFSVKSFNNAFNFPSNTLVIESDHQKKIHFLLNFRLFLANHHCM